MRSEGAKNIQNLSNVSGASAVIIPRCPSGGRLQWINQQRSCQLDTNCRLSQPTDPRHPSPPPPPSPQSHQQPENKQVKEFKVQRSPHKTGGLCLNGSVAMSIWPDERRVRNIFWYADNRSYSSNSIWLFVRSFVSYTFFQSTVVHFKRLRVLFCYQVHVCTGVPQH